MNPFLQAAVRAAQAAAQAAANRSAQPQRKSAGGCTPCQANAYVAKLRAQVAKR